MIDFLSANTGWIKDLIIAICTIIATIYAVKTYIRAKATILAPKRNEVIKIQTQLLVDFLKSTTDNAGNIDSSLEYLSVFTQNYFFDKLKLDMPSLKNDEEMFNQINSSIAGWYNKSENDAGVQLMIGNLDDLIWQLEKLKIIPLVIITKKAMATIVNIRDLINNPFIPDEIVTMLKHLLENITHNYFVIMPTCYDSARSITPPHIMVSYQEFERQRRQHKEDSEKLNAVIRKYLGINDKW